MACLEALRSSRICEDMLWSWNQVRNVFISWLQLLGYSFLAVSFTELAGNNRPSANYERSSRSSKQPAAGSVDYLGGVAVVSGVTAR